jgi:putative NADPH-quinone reductase
MISTTTNHTRILGIVGSPRRNGNTEILIDEVLQGAEKIGAVSEKIILNELDITPCQACDKCGKKGRCVIQDDMQGVLEQMEQSQVWVLGTPVYYWGPTAQFKAFIDRWYGAKRPIFVGHRVILVIPLGANDPNYARHTVGMLHDALDWQQTKLVRTILAPGVFAAGDIRHFPNILAEARQAGAQSIEQEIAPGKWAAQVYEERCSI